MNAFPKDYSGFTVQDLLDDDAFVNLIKKRNLVPEALSEWESLLSRHPHKQEAFLEAADLITILAEHNTREDEESLQRVWKGIAREIHTTTPVVSNNRPLSNVLKIAAIFILSISAAGLAVWYFTGPASTVKWHTASKQFKLINLPDQSVITLGANSTLKYNQNWKKSSPREVWLSGEAHFEVKHLNKDSLSILPAERFVVHVNDELEVEVLGTVFNVTHKAGKTAVELETGSVKIVSKKNNGDIIWLKPGEKAELDLSSNKLARLKSFKEELHAGWQDSAIELNNTSVKEIIQLIEKTHHKKIEVEDPSILDRRIDGSFPLYHEKDVWFILSSILDVDVEIKSNDVFVLKTR